MRSLGRPWAVPRTGLGILRRASPVLVALSFALAADPTLARAAYAFGSGPLERAPPKGGAPLRTTPALADPPQDAAAPDDDDDGDDDDDDGRAPAGSRADRPVQGQVRERTDGRLEVTVDPGDAPEPTFAAVRLRYAIDDDVEGCPTVEQLGDAVASRLGYAPFSDDGERTLDVRIFGGTHDGAGRATSDGGTGDPTPADRDDEAVEDQRAEAGAETERDTGDDDDGDTGVGNDGDTGDGGKHGPDEANDAKAKTSTERPPTGGLRAEVRLFDRGGGVLGERVLDGPTGDCAALARALVPALAIAIDPLALVVAPQKTVVIFEPTRAVEPSSPAAGGAPAPPPSAVGPAVAAGAVAAPPSPAAEDPDETGDADAEDPGAKDAGADDATADDEKREEDTAVDDATAVGFSWIPSGSWIPFGHVGLAYVAHTGPAATTSWVFGGGVRWGSYSLALEHRPEPESAGTYATESGAGVFTSALSSTSLVGCAHVLWLSGCGMAHAGWQELTVAHAGPDFVLNADDGRFDRTVPYAAVGARGALDIPLGYLFVRAYGELRVPLTRPSLVLDKDPLVVGTPQLLWAQPELAGALGVAVGFRWD